nr:apoptotic chromatin condensation inducer in the nucleus-like [Lytechinus pictus]
MEDGATASEGKPVAMTMGTDEGKDDAASAETPETNETEDGEIKEEGEVKEEEEQMETEPGVESNKEKETEPSQKVEQRSRSRSFTNVSSAPVKTKRLSFSSKDKAKETTGEEDKPEGVVNAPQVKKRRWGSTKKTTADVAKKTNVNISTQLLKDIIPEIKVPASELELDLEPEEGEESMEVGEVGETKKDEEKAEPVEDEEASQGPPRRKFIRQTITAPGAQHEEESDIDYEEDEEDDMVTRKVQQRDEDEEEEEKKEKGSGDEESDSSSEEEGDDKEGSEDDGEKEGEDGDKEERKKKKKKIETPKDEGKENKQPEVKAKKVIQIKRAVRTMIDEPIRNTERDPSPSKRELSNIIHVNNLTRPFTLPQLKELLGRYGTLSADGFWMNNIKSHCFVTYESSDEAMACREALHGTTWPSSNPKKLRVDFSDINELNRHMGVVVKKEPVKAEPAKEPERNTAARRERILHQDRERDLEQERRTKERERERERARKEREWDRGKERSQSPPERRRRTRSQERKDRHEGIV